MKTEAIPAWLIDAVAAAGLATAYADNFDTLVQHGVGKAVVPSEAGTAH